MSNHFRRDDGAVALIVAVSLVLFFALAACVVDIGFWFTAKRQLQSAADAAALAGCTDLADGRSDSQIWATVTSYAQKNFSVPVHVASSTVDPPSPGGSSDIGDNYVKVTVRTVSPSFFARVIGYDEGRISAQSVAQIGYLGGASGPIPWGLSILNVTEMSATMGGQTANLWDAGNSTWEGSFSAGLYGPVTLRAKNSVGYIEEFPNVVHVAQLPAGGIIRAVSLEKTTFTSGVDSNCRVEVSLVSTLPVGDVVTASLGSGAAVTLSLDASTGRYVGSVPIGTTTDAATQVPITVAVGPKGKPVQSATAGVLLRRANYILRDVEVSPAFAGPTDSVAIRVRTLQFDFGQQYQLKVEGGTGESGNFLALDFAATSLDHSVCGFPNTPVSPGGHGGSDYSDYIVGDPNLVIHLYDYVMTKTGDMVGPTKQGLSERLQGVTLVSFDTWVAAGRPDTKQLVLVPICEKVEDQTGKSQLKIVDFATFFIEEPPSGSQDAVVGRFVEFTSPGLVVTPTPPGPLGIKAVHLVMDHLDF